MFLWRNPRKCESGSRSMVFHDEEVQTCHQWHAHLFCWRRNLHTVQFSAIYQYQECSIVDKEIQKRFPSGTSSKNCYWRRTPGLWFTVVDKVIQRELKKSISMISSETKIICCHSRNPDWQQELLVVGKEIQISDFARQNDVLDNEIQVFVIHQYSKYLQNQNKKMLEP